MSDESPGKYRRLREDEKALIGKMARGSVVENAVLHHIQDAFVKDMRDGGMGSIRFHYEGDVKRIFGRQTSEAVCKDVDGVVVSITLNVDRLGDIFELDIWKVNDTPLIAYPKPDDVEMVNRSAEKKEAE